MARQQLVAAARRARPRAAPPGRCSPPRRRAARSPAAARGPPRCVRRAAARTRPRRSRGRPGTCWAQTSSPVLAADHEPAEQRRRDVVGVALEPAGQGRARRASSKPSAPPSHEAAGEHDAADDRRRRRAEARGRAGSGWCRTAAGRAACTPIASNAASIARTTRWRSSSGTSPAPSPATCTSSGPSDDLGRRGCRRRSSARPRQSKPGPRLALVAGTLTRDRSRRRTPRQAHVSAARRPRPRRPRRRRPRCRRGR